MPLGQNEGPIGMVICPSRELATQTYEIAEQYSKVRQSMSRIAYADITLAIRGNFRTAAPPERGRTVAWEPAPMLSEDRYPRGVLTVPMPVHPPCRPCPRTATPRCASC